MSDANVKLGLAIQADMKKALKQIDQLQREVSRVGKNTSGIDKFNRKLEKTQKRFKGLMAGAKGFVGVLAAYGVGRFFKEVIDKTKEQQEALALVESQLKATGNQVGFTTAELADMASQFQKTTKYGDESILRIQSQLLAFRQITKPVFKDTIQAILDFSEVTGRDASQSVRTLGQVINDPVNAMGRLTQAGVALDTETKNQIRNLAKNGHLLKAQRMLLDELENSYGGAAQAAKHKLGGAVEALGNAFGDLLEAKDGMPAATEAINDLTDTLQDPEVKKGFDNIVGGIGRIVSVSAKAITKLSEVGQGLGILLAKGGGAGDPTDQLAQTEKFLDEATRKLEVLKGAGNKADFLSAPEAAAIIQQQLGAQAKFTDENLAKAQQQLQNYIKLMRKAKADLENGAGSFGFSKPKLAETPSSSTPDNTPVTDPKEAVANAQAALKLLQDANDREMRALDARLKAHTISLSDYYQKKVSLAQSAIDAEIAAEKKKLDSVKNDAAKRKQIETQITLLERTRADVAVQASREQAAAEKDLRQQLDGVRQALLQAQGDGAQAQIEEIRKQYAELLKQLKADGNQAGIDLVESLIDTKTAQAKLDELEGKFRDTIALMQADEQSIQAQQNAGLLTELQAREQIVDLHKKASNELSGLIPKMQELAAATGNPQAVAQVKQLEAQLIDLGAAANEVKLRIQGGLKDALAGTIDDVLTGAVKGKDAVRQLGNAVFEMISKIIAEKLAAQAVDSSAGSAIGSFIASMFHTGGMVGSGGAQRRAVSPLVFAGAPRFHAGGFPGLKADEVPAILKRREEVLTANDPRNRLNGGGGGLVVQQTNTFQISAPDGRISKESQQQTAARVGQATRRAIRRNS